MLPLQQTELAIHIFQVKIIDFGTAKQLGPGEKVNDLNVSLKISEKWVKLAWSVIYI